MISWIVASHDPATFQANLAPTLPAEDELVLVEHAPSIAVAYNEGQAKATRPIRCFIHHDVVLLHPQLLQTHLTQACTDAVGIVGIVGGTLPIWPWWEGPKVGSVIDTRVGLLDFGPGGECSYLDGLLLATVHEVAWDETYQGWHGYDHDACAQMLDRGLPNWCLSEGHHMVRHNASSLTNVYENSDWIAAERRFREKWMHY